MIIFQDLRKAKGPRMSMLAAAACCAFESGGPYTTEASIVIGFAEPAEEPDTALPLLKQPVYMHVPPLAYEHL